VTEWPDADQRRATAPATGSPMASLRRETPDDPTGTDCAGAGLLASARLYGEQLWNCGGWAR
jgi:hypothetical protein